MLARFSVFLVLTLGLTISLSAVSRKSPPTRPNYKGYIVTDAATGEILAEENPDIVTPPASVTKLMTFLLVHEALASGQLTLETPVRVSVTASKMGGTQVHLDPRETFTVREMLYGLMVQSANDCAYALAEIVAGTRDIFVQRMNDRAQQLGMTRTIFRSPHGLPPTDRNLTNGDLTTPRDIALLSRELLLKTDVITYSSVQKMSFGEGQRTEATRMENHNNLLGKVAGVDGLKTGYTKGAGYCLSATAQRDGRRIIVVIMGSLGAGGQIDVGKSRDLKTIELLEANFPKIPASSRFTSRAHPAPSSTTPASAPASDALITPAAVELNSPAQTPVSPALSPAAPATLPEETPAPKIQFQLPSSTTKPAKPGSTVKQK